MRRSNVLTIRLSNREAMILQLAANITHPTPTGGNTAASIRDAAIKRAIWQLAPGWCEVTINPTSRAIKWWADATADPSAPPVIARLQSHDSAVLSAEDLLEFLLWSSTLPEWDDQPVNIEPAPNLADLDDLRLAMINEDPRVSDWSTLPTYGGPPLPKSGHGVWGCIWSWDRDAVLVGTCGDDLKIIPRGDL